MSLKSLKPLCIPFCLAWSCILGAGDVLERPGPGSPERSRILDAARVEVAEELDHDSKTLKFVVKHMCLLGDWAFLDATPVSRKLIPLVRDCVEGEDHLDNLTVLLLKRNEDGWQVVRGGSLCAGDVPWLGWREEDDLKGVVPDAIFRCPEERP
jgi:hypothetical protein